MTTPRTKRQRPEEIVQCAVAAWLRTQQFRLHCIWWHTPSTFDSMQFGRRMKAAGHRSGIPDLTFVGTDKTCFVELKSEKGVLSGDQKKVRDYCGENSIPHAVVKTNDPMEAIEQVSDLLLSWGLMTLV